MEELEVKEDTRRNKIMKHIRENRKNYVIAYAVGTVIGAVGMRVYLAYYGVSYEEIADAQLNSFVNCIKGSRNGIYQRISIYGNVIGRHGKAIYDTTDKKFYKAQYLGAEAVGATSDMMSKHLNGKLPNLNGHVFERVPTE